ncbi:MAG: hypothetical protein V1810_02320 [Candidatus Beckwithbacteria bacterium]
MPHNPNLAPISTDAEVDGLDFYTRPPNEALAAVEEWKAAYWREETLAVTDHCFACVITTPQGEELAARLKVLAWRRGEGSLAIPVDRVGIYMCLRREKLWEKATTNVRYFGGLYLLQAFEKMGIKVQEGENNFGQGFYPSEQDLSSQTPTWGIIRLERKVDLPPNDILDQSSLALTAEGFRRAFERVFTGLTLKPLAD